MAYSTLQTLPLNNLSTGPIPQLQIRCSQPAIYSSSNDYNEVSKQDGPTCPQTQGRKPSRDGTLRPAQASEIYLTTQDLKVLLQGSYKDPAIAGEFVPLQNSGQRQKRTVLKTEIAGVKSILLSAKVGRARTDPYGQASMENLSLTINTM